MHVHNLDVLDYAANGFAGIVSLGPQWQTASVPATVSFDAWDCGAGVPATAQATINGASAAVTQIRTSGPPPCGSVSSNPRHHFSFTLDVSALSALDTPDATGTSLVHLSAAAMDLVANPTTSATSDAKVSLWRWRQQLAGNITGSPTLLEGTAGSRSVVIGTDASTASSAPNLFVLGPDGSLQWTSSLSAGISADVAVGQGALYAVSNAGTCTTTTTCGTINIVVLPTTPQNGASVSPITPCTISGASSFAPPTVTLSTGASPSELAIFVAGSQDTGANNVYVVQDVSGACKVQDSELVNTYGALAGVSSTRTDALVFFSHQHGFSSLKQNGTAFDLTSITTFAGGTQAVTAAAAPSLSGSGASLNPIFGTLSADEKVYRTSWNGGVPPTWQTASGFTPSTAANGLSLTPVFDGTNIYAADANGNVSAWTQSSGAQAWTHAVGGSPRPLVSAPVLLQGGFLLVVQQDGSVKLVSSATVSPSLVNVGSFGSAVPFPPAVDQRNGGGVAYVPSPSGWTYALQIPSAPTPASSTVWPRPGRDSCNSRNAGSACP